MQKYPDFWSVLLGNGPHGLFFGYVVLSLIACIGMILVMAAQKYKNVDASPNKWSWHYFLANNAGNLIAGVFLLPIFVRLIYQYIDAGWMIAVSVGLGFCFFGLAKVANNFGIWTTTKLSERIADKIKNQKD